MLNSKLHKRVLITGGGTGGHIFPLVAIAKKINQLAIDQKLNVEICYFGPKSVYNDYLSREGVIVNNIIGAKWRRYWSFWNIVDIPRFIFSFCQSLIKIYWYMPNVAFSKGGTGALPVLLACWLYRIPIIIHESDTVPGLTNKISSQWAKKIELGWEMTQKYFSQCREADRCQIVGIPLRDELLGKLDTDQSNAKKSLGFSPDLPLLVVFGGSQGAQKINEFILANLDIFLSKFQILHQVGSANYDGHWPKEIKSESRYQYKAFAFFENNLAETYAAADLILSRAGATVIFEIAAFGKPSILIPLPEAAGDHQRINAYEYIKTGAAIVIEEDNLLDNVVLYQMEKILYSPALKQKMAIAAKAFSKLKTADVVAHDILNCG